MKLGHTPVKDEGVVHLMQVQGDNIDEDEKTLKESGLGAHDEMDITSGMFESGAVEQRKMPICTNSAPKDPGKYSDLGKAEGGLFLGP